MVLGVAYVIFSTGSFVGEDGSRSTLPVRENWVMVRYLMSGNPAIRPLRVRAGPSQGVLEATT